MAGAHDLTPVRLVDAAHQLEAAVIPGAGMIVASLQHRGEELLGQRRGLDAYVRDGKTTGIPLLAPWANRVGVDEFVTGGVAVDLRGEHPGLRRDPSGLPIHGLLAADRGWTVEEATPSSVLAVLDLSARPELLRSFPFPHRLEYRVELSGGVLALELGIVATGTVAVPVAHGLHPYLTLPGAARETWQVELPARVHLELDAHGLPDGSRSEEPALAEALGDRVFDDAYLLAGGGRGAAFVVAGGGRRIVTTFVEGVPAAQVLAPREDAVICFEPMAAPTNALVTGDALRFVAPGARDAARVEIAVIAA